MKRAPTWRHRVVICSVLLAAYGLFLITLAPASLIDAGLRRASHGTLRLAQAQGTLWSGGGRLEVRDASGQRGVGQDLSWALQPRALLRGQLDYRVGIGHAGGRFPVRISAQGVELSDVDFTLPAAALGVAVPRMAPLGLQGEILVHVARFARTGALVSADAVVTWQDASSALTPVAPLGTYELRVDGTAGVLTTSLRTRSGPLQLAGGGSWQADASPAFSVTARVDAAHHAQLAPLLRLIAVERDNGDFALQFDPPLADMSRVGAPASPR